MEDKITPFIRMRGPVLPADVSKVIGTDILMASVYLSELVSKKALKVSALKVGGSPLYYLPGQEARLQEFSSKLNAKEKEAYSLLRAKLVLKDTELEPVSRVALRAIRDFAVPLQANNNGNLEIFWKWYLLPSNEAEEIIRGQLKPIKEEIPEQKIAEPIKKEVKEEKQKITKEAEIKKPDIKREEQRTIKEIQKTEIPKKEEKPIKDMLFNEIQDYFSKNKIKIIEQKIIRKNAEISFIVEVPSSVGNLRYYCIAKTKRKINDGDLSSAYIQAQSKKLPVLFLAKGDLTKKAREMLEKEFKGFSFNKI